MKTNNNWFNFPIADSLISIEKERVEWQPYQMNLATQTKTSEQVQRELSPETSKLLSRCCLLATTFELPVGAYVNQLLEHDKDNQIPDGYKFGLISNVHDEIKHDKVFNYIGNYFLASEEDKNYVQGIKKKIIKSSKTPLQLARDMETVIFVPLQAMVRWYLRDSQQVERAILEVTQDENRHLIYNWELSTILNIAPIDEDFNDFLEGVSLWILEPICKDTSSMFNFWKNCIAEMKNEVYSEGLKNLFNQTVKRAAFEISNSFY